MDIPNKISSEDRERAVLRYLKELGETGGTATVKRIWEAMADRLGDEVTQQAYYKLMIRLSAVGKVDLVQEKATDDVRRYRLSPHLHSENAMTLDDVYEQLEHLSAPDAISRVLDARDYFEERRHGTLRRVAEALLDENPRTLVKDMVLHKFEALRSDLELLADGQLRDRELESRVNVQFRELQLIAYRYLGLSRAAIDVARAEGAKSGKSPIRIDADVMTEELQRRVFGEKFIFSVDVRDFRRSDDWERLTVAGSDGSTHASVMQLSTAPAYADDVGHQVITFNNSVAFVDYSSADARHNRAGGFPYHSVPMTRSALEDPVNRGMIMAPFMYRYLSESEYEHMAKCATDVVQWRVDEEVFLGTARSLKDGGLLPRPRVHIRDGTVTPQEREFGHYKRRNEYGDMVREGIARSRAVLDKILAAPGQPPIFAGAVKATQLHLFSTVLNWYISQGSKRRFSEPLDPNWDVTRAAHISDNEAMSILLSTLEGRRSDGVYFVTCAIARPFHTLTEFYRSPEHDDISWWLRRFERMRDEELKRYEAEADQELPFLATVPDIADENYVFKMQRADYALFYIGHTTGDPPPIAPRYEFIESLRSKSPDLASQRVLRNIREIVAALDRTSFSADREHNYLTNKSLVKVIPYVIYEAHEKCKALGRQLEAELRSVVIANLKRLKNMRGLRASDFTFAPVSIRRFVERYEEATNEERRRDPDKYTR